MRRAERSHLPERHTRRARARPPLLWCCAKSVAWFLPGVGRLAPPPWMCALIDHVERGPVSSNARSRRRRVPKVCAALRRRDPFENVGRRRTREVTAHDEAALAAVRVGDAHYEQARTAVCGVPDVVMRQWKRAGSHSETHQACHRVAAASRRPATRIEGLPGPTTGYVLWVSRVRAICAGSR